jgi:hypothetical protein
MIQLQQKFNNIKYVDKHHQYYNSDTGESLLSVTTLLKRLRKPFDSYYWSTYTALKRNGYKVKPSPPFKIYVDDSQYDINEVNTWVMELTPEDIKREWDIAGKTGTTLGTFLHNTVENKIHRKEIEQDIPAFVSGLRSLEAIKYLKSREILTNLANVFYDEFIQNYTPLYTEFVVGDTELGISGTFDLLVLNNKTGEIELWDYKTDKEIRYVSEYRNKISYFNIDDCEFNKYSLQLNIYKYLIEKNTDLKISKCKIVHFDYRNNNLNVLETSDYSQIVKEFFENDDNKSIYF